MMMAITNKSYMYDTINNIYIIKRGNIKIKQGIMIIYYYIGCVYNIHVRNFDLQLCIVA